MNLSSRDLTSDHATSQLHYSSSRSFPSLPQLTPTAPRLAVDDEQAVEEAAGCITELGLTGFVWPFLSFFLCYGTRELGW